VIALFREILLVSDEMGLIGKEMFAIDGCKIPSNASKEWSGTRADFERKSRKLEETIRKIVRRHREMDQRERDGEVVSREKKYVERLRGQVKKIRSWLKENDDKPGSRGGVRKSNITDNESAKMKSSHGVIQGYDGVAVVDEKHQVIVHAEAFGEAQEHGLLEPMVEGTRENFQAMGEEEIFEKVKVTADSGFHTELNMKMLVEEGIDGYVADKLFRKRDPRFAGAERYKERSRRERDKRVGRKKLFTPQEFIYDRERMTCLCPAGRHLYRNGSNVVVKGYKAVKFHGLKTECRVCELRARCLKYPERTEARQVYFFENRSEEAPETFTQKMKRKIDSVLGSHIYSRRIGTVEPVFANIRNALGIRRFTLRGKRKVNIQWKLYCAVHNLIKIHRFGAGFA
jgi:hypothetical protein